MANDLELIKSYDEFRRDSERREKPAEQEAPDAEAGSQPPPAVASPQPRADDASGQSDVAAAQRALAPAQRPAAPVQEPQEEGAAEDLYGRALAAVSSLFEAAASEKTAPGTLQSRFVDLERISPEIVSSTAESRDLLRKAMGIYAEGEGFVLPHSVNVAVLAIYLGRELGIAGDGLAELCLAGLAHDVGSVHLSQGLLTKSDTLTAEEWEQMRSRPSRSYEMLRKLDGDYGKVAEIVHQVYERLDGSGYPRGLQGDEILPEACILGTVDFFESFAHPRPYKSTVPGGANHGIQMLMQMSDKFGVTTLKALVGSIGLFPIGSYVRLSGGEVGRVVDVKRENPMRPQVEVLLTSERQPPRESRTLDLLSTPHIYVSRALSASDLRELGLLPPPRDLPPTRRFDNRGS